MKLIKKPKTIVPGVPKTIAPEIRELCRSIGGGDLARIRIDPKGVLIGCLFNCSELAGEVGGEVVRGWSVWELPGVYLCAEDHAFVEKDGVYFDPTPTQDGDRQILFLSQQVVAGLTPIRPNHYLPLSKKSQVVRACEQYREGVVRSCRFGQVDYYIRLCSDQGDALIEAHLRYSVGKKKRKTETAPALTGAVITIRTEK